MKVIFDDIEAQTKFPPPTLRASWASLTKASWAPPGQDVSEEARTRDRKVSADLGAGEPATVPAMPPL
ncbi:hypothetical protein PoB_007058100 [Plakobranchus ocellatus]|uniref:Uncharacterized protein n=1 Tax=Plakobranchus ocellatus TaxID=259542 RepID=A0AAV4DIU6_9GAST|nr:hypothetical protein PoB_007058100 [Plakobranchus ocellatus]